MEDLRMEEVNQERVRVPDVRSEILKERESRREPELKREEDILRSEQTINLCNRELDNLKNQGLSESVLNDIKRNQSEVLLDVKNRNDFFELAKDRFSNESYDSLKTLDNMKYDDRKEDNVYTMVKEAAVLYRAIDVEKNDGRSNDYEYNRMDLANIKVDAIRLSRALDNVDYRADIQKNIRLDDRCRFNHDIVTNGRYTDFSRERYGSRERLRDDSFIKREAQYKIREIDAPDRFGDRRELSRREVDRIERIEKSYRDMDLERGLANYIKESSVDELRDTLYNVRDAYSLNEFKKEEYKQYDNYKDLLKESRNNEIRAIAYLDKDAREYGATYDSKVRTMEEDLGRVVDRDMDRSQRLNEFRNFEKEIKNYAHLDKNDRYVFNNKNEEAFKSLKEVDKFRAAVTMELALREKDAKTLELLDRKIDYKKEDATYKLINEVTRASRMERESLDRYDEKTLDKLDRNPYEDTLRNLEYRDKEFELNKELKGSPKERTEQFYDMLLDDYKDKIISRDLELDISRSVGSNLYSKEINSRADALIESIKYDRDSKSEAILNNLREHPDKELNDIAKCYDLKNEAIEASRRGFIQSLDSESRFEAGEYKGLNPASIERLESKELEREVRVRVLEKIETLQRDNGLIGSYVNSRDDSDMKKGFEGALDRSISRDEFESLKNVTAFKIYQNYDRTCEELKNPLVLKELTVNKETDLKFVNERNELIKTEIGLMNNPLPREESIYEFFNSRVGSNELIERINNGELRDIDYKNIDKIGVSEVIDGYLKGKSEALDGNIIDTRSYTNYLRDSDEYSSYMAGRLMDLRVREDLKEASVYREIDDGKYTSLTLGTINEERVKELNTIYQNIMDERTLDKVFDTGFDALLKDENKIEVLSRVYQSGLLNDRHISKLPEEYRHAEFANIKKVVSKLESELSENLKMVKSEKTGSPLDAKLSDIKFKDLFKFDEKGNYLSQNLRNDYLDKLKMINDAKYEKAVIREINKKSLVDKRLDEELNNPRQFRAQKDILNDELRRLNGKMVMYNRMEGRYAKKEAELRERNLNMIKDIKSERGRFLFEKARDTLLSNRLTTKNIRHLNSEKEREKIEMTGVQERISEIKKELAKIEKEEKIYINSIIERERGEASRKVDEILKAARDDKHAELKNTITRDTRAVLTDLEKRGEYTSKEKRARQKERYLKQKADYKARKKAEREQAKKARRAEKRIPKEFRNLEQRMEESRESMNFYELAYLNNIIRHSKNMSDYPAEYQEKLSQVSILDELTNLRLASANDEKSAEFFKMAGVQVENPVGYQEMLDRADKLTRDGDIEKRNNEIQDFLNYNAPYQRLTPEDFFNYRNPIDELIRIGQIQDLAYQTYVTEDEGGYDYDMYDYIGYDASNQLSEEEVTTILEQEYYQEPIMEEESNEPDPIELANDYRNGLIDRRRAQIERYNQRHTKEARNLE